MLHVFTNHLAKRIHPMISNIVKPHRETLMLGWTCIAAPSLPAALTHSLLHSYRASSRRFQGTHLTLITGANRASSPLFPAERASTPGPLQRPTASSHGSSNRQLRLNLPFPQHHSIMADSLAQGKDKPTRSVSSRDKLKSVTPILAPTSLPMSPSS